MPTQLVLDDTFSDPTTVNVASRPALVGGPWTPIEVTAGAGVDGARVIGGTGFAHSSSGSGQSGNRSPIVLPAGLDWDVYFELNRPNNFGGVRLMAGADVSGVGGYTLVLSNFSDIAAILSDSTSFSTSGQGATAVSVGHVMPQGLSTYQLQKRGAVFRMFRGNVQLGTDWTDPSPTADAGCVMFYAANSDNIGISRVWATIEAPDTALTGDITTDPAAPTGTLQSNPPSTLTGDITTDAAAPTGGISSGAAPGTVVLSGWDNLAGMPLTSTPVARITMQRLSDGVQVLNLPGLTTSSDPATPVISITNAALVAGTFYLAIANNADGTVLGVERVQAV